MTKRTAMEIVGSGGGGGERWRRWGAVEAVGNSGRRYLMFISTLNTHIPYMHTHVYIHYTHMHTHTQKGKKIKRKISIHIFSKYF